MSNYTETEVAEAKLLADEVLRFNMLNSRIQNAIARAQWYKKQKGETYNSTFIDETLKEIPLSYPINKMPTLSRYKAMNLELGSLLGFLNNHTNEIAEKYADEIHAISFK